MSSLKVKLNTPYADRLLPIEPSRLRQYLDAEWAHLKEGLYRVLTSGDILCELPVLLDSIRRYILDNGLRLSKAERIALLRLCLSLVCCPNVDLAVNAAGLNLAHALLRRSWTLSRKSLNLDWSHFCNMAEWLTTSSEAQLGLLHKSKHDLDSFFGLLKMAKKFFPPSCIEEVWMKYRHRMLYCMLDGSEFYPFNKLHVLTPFYPDCFDIISRTWLPDVFNLWYLISDFGRRFHDVIRLFSQLAHTCPGRVHWDPHLERVFGSLFRALISPGSPVSMTDSGNTAGPSVFGHYATLLVYAIGPEVAGSPSPVTTQLQNLYKALAPFYHPSNPSKSTSMLIAFTHDFARALFERLRNELLPPLDRSLGVSPSEFHLSVKQVDKLVHLLLPVVLDYMLFCKFDRDLYLVVRTIDTLAKLRPRFIMPKLLASLEDGLSRPESPLRYSRPLLALGLCVSSFSHVRFPFFSRRSIDMEDAVRQDTSDDGDISEEPADDKSELSSDENGDLVNTEFFKENHLNSKSDPLDTCGNEMSGVRLNKAHIEAFLYPEGRAQVVHILDILLTGFDPNLADRFNMTVGCLCRIFLSTPARDSCVHPSETCFSGTRDHGLDHFEETVTRVFLRVLEQMVSLNDRSASAPNLTSGVMYGKHMIGDGRAILRPYACPEGQPRSDIDTCVLSNLTGLVVSIAISSASNPKFRCHLLRLLVDGIFDTQWEPDTARLLAYQCYWLSVNSKCFISANMEADESCQSDLPIDTAMFALTLMWPRFLSIVRELRSDNCLVHRGRVDPRLLSLLYILPGPLSALHPSKLLERGFRDDYLVPLLNLLYELLYLSTGGLIPLSTTDVLLHLMESSSPKQIGTSCPVLAEAASALLAVLLHRITGYTIDLTSCDLMSIASDNSFEETLFITSQWWTPFISAREFFSQYKNRSTTVDDDANVTVPTFWIAPSLSGRSLASDCLRKFLFPIIHRLDEVNSVISCVRNVNLFRGFSPELPLTDQRDHLSSLLIWTNNILCGIADVLAPRLSDSGTHENTFQFFPDMFPPNYSFFECVFPNATGRVIGLREHIFNVGLRLLENIADLFKLADDTLTVDHRSDREEVSDADCHENSMSKSSHPVGLLFHWSQIHDLLCFLRIAAFNQTSPEQYPCLTRTTLGPVALNGLAFGAYSCVSVPPSDVVHAVAIIPTLANFIGPPCYDSALRQPFSDPIPHRGRVALSWIAILQDRFLRLLKKQLRQPLTTSLCGRISPTPQILRFVHAMGILATAPRRDDIRQLVSGLLVSTILPDVDQASIDIVTIMIERLEDAATLTQGRSLHSSHRLTENDLEAVILPDAHFKLIAHRQSATINLLSRLLYDVKNSAQSDELLRLDLSIQTRSWIAILSQALHHPEAAHQCLTAAQLHYRRTTHDRLERLVLRSFERVSAFLTNYTLHCPSNHKEIPKSSSLLHVCDEANALLSVLHPSCCNIAIQFPNTTLLQTISERRIVIVKFLNDLFNQCFSHHKIMGSNNQSCQSKIGHVGQALISRLLKLLPRPVDAPLTPSWLPNSVLLAPPPPPPPLLLVKYTLHLLTSYEPHVAQAACEYLSDLLFVQLLRHRACRLVEISTSSRVPAASDMMPSHSDLLIPAPRPDNKHLLFDANNRILSSEDVYRKHHHLPTLSVGYTCFPPTFVMCDPFSSVPYPIFSFETGKLDVDQPAWLSHLNKTTEESMLTRSCLSLLACHLASPSKATREFWLLLADRLLHLHHKPDHHLFPLGRLLIVCALSFGPNPFVHHVEACFRALLSVNTDGTTKPFDGLTEVVGYAWLRLGLVDMSSAIFRWPREWQHYYLARTLPRLLALAELQALSVSTSAMAHTTHASVHKTLMDGLILPLRYAGDFGGEGSHSEDQVDSTRQSMPSAQPVGEQQISTESSTSIAQSQAGGALNRLGFMADFIFSSFHSNAELDFSRLHPLWDWIQCGLATCENDLPNSTSLSSTGNCTHSIKSILPLESLTDVTDECPTCLLNRCLPRAHRHVFYTRLCVTFITHIGWRGTCLFPFFSKCVYTGSCSLSDSVASNSTWFQKASNDSVWMRDLAATVAVYRAAIPHSYVFHTCRVPLQLTSYSTDRQLIEVVSPRTIATRLDDADRFLQFLFSNLNDKEPVGVKFVSDVFLSHLVRDTLTVLKLKGYQPSEASLNLLATVSSNFSEARKDINGSLLAIERGTCVEARPLTNRLRCMYACLPALLTFAFPAVIRPDLAETQSSDSVVSIYHFCVTLAPLLADVSSMGNLYKRVSRQFSMCAFDSARNVAEYTDEYTDGLESGVALLFYRFSLITLVGQGNPQGAVQNCLELTRPFLIHSSWKSRSVGLLFLRNLVVMNLPAFWEMERRVEANQDDSGSYGSLVHEIRQALMDRLADTWLQVCQLAMYTLAVFVQIGLLKFQCNWVNLLIEKAKTPYPRRSNTVLTSSEDSSLYHKAIRERHAGILGLAALVHAYPHTTPIFLPGIIAELATHVHDPHPIERTVRDTLSAYSRSHQDAWHEQRDMFSEDQLQEYLSVVSAATYYV